MQIEQIRERRATYDPERGQKLQELAGNITASTSPIEDLCSMIAEQWKDDATAKNIRAAMKAMSRQARHSAIRRPAQIREAMLQAGVPEDTLLAATRAVIAQDRLDSVRMGTPNFEGVFSWKELNDTLGHMDSLNKKLETSGGEQLTAQEIYRRNEGAIGYVRGLIEKRTPTAADQLDQAFAGKYGITSSGSLRETVVKLCAKALQQQGLLAAA